MSSYLDIISSLKQRKFKPIYFLHGTEPFFIDQISDYIENNVLDESEKAFNLSILYGRDTEIGQILETVKRFPMMSEYQLVIIKEAQDLKKIEELEGYFNNPLNSTILVICHKYKNADKRKKYLKAALKTGVVFESSKLYENAIPKWIQDYAHAKGLKIAPKSTILLSEFLGNDLQKISNEIEKLEIILGHGATITPESIEDNIGISKDFNNFELQKALSIKDTFKAFQIVTYFANNPKEHSIFMILPSLAKHFTRILTIQYEKNKNPKHLASVLKMSPFFISEIIQASNLYSPRRVTEIIHEIKLADLASKGIDTTNNNEGEILKELIYKILN